MTSPTWSPQQYLKFADPRSRPFSDLAGRVLTTDPRTVIDLGCGPGNATRTLLDRWPDARVLGIDSNAHMIDAAQQMAATEADGRLSFALADIRSWQPDEPVDVMLANAVLHWLPEHVDHFAGWIGALRPGGTLAFQVPLPAEARGAAALHEVTSRPRWASRLSGIPTPGALSSDSPVRSAPEYTDILSRLGCTVDAWETTYAHVLPGDDPVLEWFAGSGLRPYTDRLDDDDANAFRAEVGAELRIAFPRQPYGTILPFRRVFVVAQRQ